MGMGEKTCTCTCTCFVGDDDFLPLPLPLHLPEQVLIEIILWLPVISLLRFKSVCKSWRSLINSSFFNDLRNATTSSSKFGNFIFQTTDDFFFQTTQGEFGHLGEMNISMLTSESGSRGQYWGTDNDHVQPREVFKVDDNGQEVFKVDNLGFPLCYKFFHGQLPSVYVVGSCNGLICIHDSKRRDISLWNPATRQFRILPKSIAFGHYLEDFFGFGYDVKTEDYKVVQITCTHIKYTDDYICRVQVYSLSTDSWRLLLDGINALPAQATPKSWTGHTTNQGIYINGSYIFVGSKMASVLETVLLSFDFTKEIFNTMQLPGDVDVPQTQYIVLSYLGEKMALFRTIPNLKSIISPSGWDRDDDGYDNCDIWVLNNQSWTKLHSFRIKLEKLGETVPRGISNNGEFALIGNRYDRDSEKTMQLFNLVTKETKKDFLICKQVIRAYAYKPSVVSIKGGNGA